MTRKLTRKEVVAITRRNTAYIFSYPKKRNSYGEVPLVETQYRPSQETQIIGWLDPTHRELPYAKTSIGSMYPAQFIIEDMYMEELDSIKSLMDNRLDFDSIELVVPVPVMQGDPKLTVIARGSYTYVVDKTGIHRIYYCSGAYKSLLAHLYMRDTGARVEDLYTRDTNNLLIKRTNYEH